MHQIIDGAEFRKIVLAGANRVISRQDYLNKINVFPVPDSDTGTNMAYTMATISEGLQEIQIESIAEVSQSVADFAIDGARGNSGSILAQFFVGLAAGMKNNSQLTIPEFAEAVVLAKKYARDALSVPREGTILDVISSWATSFHELSDKITEFREIMNMSFEKAVESLKETTMKLKELERAGVVDAGAQGFVDLLEGILEYLNTGKIPEVDKIRTVNVGVENFTYNEKYRYCTECIVSGKEIDRQSLREKLAEFGDSLVIAGTPEKIKIHIHTDHPKKVMQYCETLGKLSGEKADDMLKQQKDAHAVHADTAIIVDSSCDITPEIMEKKNIHMIPVRLNFGNDHYVDKITMNNDDFWRILKTNPNHPKTSQPAIGDFKRQYQFISSHYKSAVSIHLPAITSGTFQAALNASKTLLQFPIYVFDSLSVSGGIGLIAIAAADAANNGKSIEEIKKEVERAILKTKVYIGLDNLDFGVRGGRVPKVAKTLAQFFRLNPILTLAEGGKPKIGGVTFGFDNKHEKFKNYVISKMDNSKKYRVFITHSRIPEMAQKFADEFILKYGEDNVFMCEMGPALAVHAGPQALSISVQEV